MSYSIIQRFQLHNTGVKRAFKFKAEQRVQSFLECYSYIYDYFTLKFLNFSSNSSLNSGSIFA